MLRSVNEVARAASESGVRIAFLKGTDLNLRVYPVAGIRPMADVDLLVAEAERDALARTLARLGFVSAASPGATGPGRPLPTVRHPPVAPPSAARRPGSGAPPSPMQVCADSLAPATSPSW